ncbi:MAG TPA: Mth938-like domain-containing protein [Rhodanobacteraceae bacterium]|nr:Mth938-like domain-containing protein [Rhodanobacteraceae bacterium]
MLQLSLNRPGEHLFVRAASAEAITVVDRVLTRSFLLAADRAQEVWPVQDLAQLDATAIDAVLALRPEVVILGTGARAVFPPPAVQAQFLQRGIGLETMDNAAAARTFNVLVSEGRRAVAAFILPG